MAITSFGILMMALRQRDVNEDFLNSEVLGHVRRVVNAIPFEQFGANFKDEGISCERISNDDLCGLDCNIDNKQQWNPNKYNKTTSRGN